MPAPPPSTRLLRAVAAERDQLERHRTRMAEEADELRRVLARIERGLAEIDERRALLDRVAGEERTPRRDRAPTRGAMTGGIAGGAAGSGGSAMAGEAASSSGAADSGGSAIAGETANSGGSAMAGEAGSGGAAGAGGSAVNGDDAGAGGAANSGVSSRAGGDRVLRGPEIREAAVRVLVERGAGEALHYREWFALLVDAGHAIAGKDPLAVFLTQLGRSPAVRRGSGAGVYELDRHATARLRAALEALQRELRELTSAPGPDLSAIRARRERLNAEIGRVERALEEIARVLGPAPPLAAAG